jgi:NADPH-dependent 2,4-dienoyl-CoA reductase/sulfur reductase-like enzyme
MGQANKVVVIGCSGCGALAGRMLKKLKPSLDVTIIREQEEKGLLTRCATPYICCGNVMVDPSYKDDNIFRNQGIKLVDVRAEDINRKQKIVMTAEGKGYSYDKLVLATGAKAIIPPISGVKLPGVFTLRTSTDAVNILHWMNSQRAKNVTLLGAGAIGIEIAYLVAQHGVKVTLVEMLEHIMQKVLDADMSEQVEEYIRNKGIDLRLQQKVSAISGQDKVDKVVLSSNEEIEADMVIISAGTRSNTELAEKTDLQIGEFGLEVNEYLQTSDPDIYAAGDVIQYNSHITGKPTVGQLRPNAVIGGRVIAKNILGYKIKFPPLVNSFATKFFDKSIAGTGITESEAKSEGIEVISAKQNSASKHSMMRERKPYTVKLIFDKNSEKVIGGQIISDSECPVKHIDVITVAIRSGLNVLDLTTLRCAGQPELSPDPGMEPISLAAENVFGQLY